MDILQAMDDPAVFGHVFRNTDSWQAWRAFLAALFGLPLTPEQLVTYQRCTGRSMPPLTRAVEGWLVCGRRAGKSFILAVTAVFLAAFFDWRPHLNIGERGTIMIIAADRRQARTILRYVKGLLQSVPMLAQLIENERQESINLSNRITIEVHSASFRTTRGYTIVAALLDELAFWRNDEGSSNPDHEIINSIRPSDGDGAQRHAALRLQPVRPQRRVVGKLSSVLWPGGCAADPVLASRHPHHEPDRVRGLHR